MEGKGEKTKLSRDRMIFKQGHHPVFPIYVVIGQFSIKWPNSSTVKTRGFL